MRISDWSSDVCSSDLADQHDEAHLGQDVVVEAAQGDADQGRKHAHRHDQNDREGQAPALVLRRQGRSEEHTSELQPLVRNSYAVFCLKKKNTTKTQTLNINGTNSRTREKQDPEQRSRQIT